MQKKPSPKNNTFFNQSFWHVFVILASVLLLYSKTLSHEMINYKDPQRVIYNPTVNQGITGQGLLRAFTETIEGYHVPVTVISHQVLVQFFGLKNASSHFLFNLLLHAISSLLLFFLMRGILKSSWLSFFIAMFFALHPIMIQTVAWVSQRGILLSTCFALCALNLYVAYQREPSLQRWVFIFVFYLLSIFSSPLWVFLPFLFVLLDFWLLGILEESLVVWDDPDDAKRARRSLFEKIGNTFIQKFDLFMILLGYLGITFLITTDEIRFEASSYTLLSHFFISIPIYCLNLLWPSNISIYNPLLEYEGYSLLMLSSLFVLGILIIGWRKRGEYPWLLIGWLWFLILLILPLMGILEADAYSDCHLYAASIGVFLCVVLLFSEIARRHRMFGAFIVLFGNFVLFIYFLIAWLQLDYWKTSQTLYRVELEKKVKKGERTGENNILLNHLMIGALHEKNMMRESLPYLEKVLELQPRNYRSLHALGNAYMKEGKREKAISYYRKALDIYPKDADIQNSMAIALVGSGNLKEAKEHFKAAIKYNPNSSQIHANYANVLISLDKNYEEAIKLYRKVLENKPDDIVTHLNLANLYIKIPQLFKSTEYKTFNDLEKAAKMTKYSEPQILRSLAYAYAQKGDFKKAKELSSRAIGIAQHFHKLFLAKAIKKQLESYQKQKLPPPEEER